MPQQLEWSSVLIFFVVLTAILTFANLAMTTYEKIKHLKQPVEDKLDHIEKQLSEHEEELKIESDRAKRAEEANGIIIQCLFAILNHEITGNDIEGLKDSRGELEKILSKRV